MKKTTGLMIALFFMAQVALAQEATSAISAQMPRKEGALIINDFDYDPVAREATVYGIYWKDAIIKFEKEGEERKKGFQILTASDITGDRATVPHVWVSRLSEGDITKIDEQAIHLASVFKGEITKSDAYKLLHPSTRMLMSSGEDAKDWEELSVSHPKAFPPKAKDLNVNQIVARSAGFSGISGMLLTTPFDYNEFTGKWKEGEATAETFTFDAGTSYKTFLEGYIPDNKQQKVVVAATVGTGGRLSTFSSKKLYVVDQNGAVERSVDIELDYPKTLNFAKGVSDGDTVSGFSKGAILIYSRAFGVGKKNNDPDKTRHYAVVLDGAGAVQYQGWFNVGKEKGEFEPFEVFENNGNLMVFARVMGGEEPGYYTLVFNSQGLQATHHFDLSAVAKGDVEAGLKSYTGRKFAPTAVKKLKDGNTLIYGETYESETKTLEPEPNQTFGEKIEIRTYLADVFLIFDEAGVLTKYYLAGKSGGENSTPANLIYESDKILAFKGSRGHSVVALNLVSDRITTLNLDTINVGNPKVKVDPATDSIYILGTSVESEGEYLKCLAYPVK